jgi:hypothetical protein
MWRRASVEAAGNTGGFSFYGSKIGALTADRHQSCDLITEQIRQFN